MSERKENVPDVVYNFSKIELLLATFGKYICVHSFGRSADVILLCNYQITM